MEMVGEKILYSNPSGTFKRIKRWFKGIHYGIDGKFLKGLTGWETVVEVNVIKNTYKYQVID